MGRILAIDYGIKNCGVAVTDPLQIIVTPLKTVKTHALLRYIIDYCEVENVEKLVFGFPTHNDGEPTYLVEEIHKFARVLKEKNPSLEIDYQNERYTSIQAKDIILRSGLNRKQRQDKSRLDRVSAMLILQRYLKHI